MVDRVELCVKLVHRSDWKKVLEGEIRAESEELPASWGLSTETRIGDRVTNR
jgi:hypothetical protein